MKNVSKSRIYAIALITVKRDYSALARLSLYRGIVPNLLYKGCVAMSRTIEQVFNMNF